MPYAAQVVRAEALRAQLDPGGRPLPLVAHWHRATLPLSVQLQMLRDGHPVLPWIPFQRADGNSPDVLRDLETLRDWNMPLVMLHGGQWEEDFYRTEEYQSVPIDQTGLADDLAGNRINKVSPVSPVGPWETLGQKWTANDSVRAVVSRYPNPPKVIFISNNEAQRLGLLELETSKTYLDRYGPGRSDDFKRGVAGDGWIERYSALFKGMRAGLPAGEWSENSSFVGYNSFPPDHWGRGPGWWGEDLVLPERMNPMIYVWNGASKDLYDNYWEGDKTAFNYWSMQTEAMNLVFMKDEALAIQPNFWFEALFWDGDVPGRSYSKYLQYEAQGVEYTPELYGGWTQYSMWILVPRVAREWRASDDKRESWKSYFAQIVAGVERVHMDPVLAKFWRHGELVPNLSRPHPFNFQIPARWAEIPRWYHLSTSVDPDLPPPDLVRYGHFTMRFPVWTLARVVGSGPNREWLVYGHAPLGAREAVRVTIPGYRDVELPRIAIGGSFYHVIESTGAVTEVGLTSGPLRPMENPTPVGSDVAIPTLSQFGLLLLVGMLGALGIVIIRRSNLN